ncbi:MAG TPA: hypothetical protein VF998_04040 [Candidatus Limnocylindria bacterium]
MGSWLGRVFRGDDGERPAGMPLPGDAPEFRPAGAERIFRARRTAARDDPATGKRVIRTGVGASLTSREEAEQLAQAQAERAVEAALRGGEEARRGYAYLVDRGLEPLVETIDGQPGSARITVNVYGALVLNAASALFVDVDGADDNDASPRRAKLDALLRRRTDLGFRVYRTHAGWRYLCTTDAFDPSADDTRALMNELGADEKYVLLCRVQRSFRARLTPKPWRAGLRHLDVSTTRAISRRVVQRYVDDTWRFATTQYVGTSGRDETIAGLGPLIDYHDRWTQATSTKPLA